ncbi:hypothetical protein [Enterococcus crotali]|uniref:hypothetical protein n=1 Tax=Enterococcus crotali TaxID=1453587 RepID=UPI000472AFDD|nr:hypothetical protein [Enterococcus crotali]
MNKKVTTGSFFVAIFVAGIFYLLTKKEIFSALVFFIALSGSFPILNKLSAKVDNTNASK